MTTSISNSIKDFLLSNKFRNDINLLIYSSQVITFKRMLEIIIGRNFSNALKKEDIFVNNYFFKHLSLYQNIKFYCNVDQINERTFLKDFNLEKNYEKMKYKFFKNCDKKIWNKFEALFFLYAHDNLLVTKENFFNSLDDANNEFNSLIKDKQIFFLTHRKNTLGKNIKFFDLFMYINENDYTIYEDPKDFRSKILELS